MLKISPKYVEGNQEWRVEVDQYVPLRCRSYNGTIGARYVRIGDLSSSYLELIVDYDFLSVRGITLLSFDRVHNFYRIDSAVRDNALPCLDTTLKSRFLGAGLSRFDILECFSIAFGDGKLQVDFGRLRDTSLIFKSGPVQFCAADGAISGIMVSVDDAQKEMIENKGS